MITNPLVIQYFFGNRGQLGASQNHGLVTTMRLDNKEFTIDDLVEYEKESCRPRTELTFKLIGLSYYLKSNATWKTRARQSWSIPRLIEEELRQKVVGAACGGTHR